jgi:AraC-like DNA-binding protein
VASTFGDDRSFRFSTDGLPLRECNASLRDLYDRRLILMRLEALRDRPLGVDVQKQVMPGLGIVSGKVSGLRHLGPPHGDDLFLFVNLAGLTIASIAGRQVPLRGDALCGRPENARQTLDHPGDVRFVGLRLQRAALAPLVANIDGTVAWFIRGETGALRLLKNYLAATANDEEALASPALQRLFATHVHDLVALALGATADAACIAEGRGARAARLQAIKRDIAASLFRGEPRPTAEAMAAHHNVTPRYLHKLFEGEGLTYSEYVLKQRLERARQMLIDPRLADRTISSLAYDVGFGDLSHFNRAFRRRFQATPSEIRHMRDGVQR